MSSAKARVYADPQLDALILELEPVAAVGASGDAVGDAVNDAVVDVTLEDAEKLCDVVITGVDDLATKRWPELAGVFNQQLSDDFIQKAAPVAQKWMPQLIASLPADAVDIWREFGNEIKLAMMVATLLMVCIRTVREEKHRVIIEQQKQVENEPA